MPSKFIQGIIWFTKLTIRSRCVNRKKYPRCDLTRSTRKYHSQNSSPKLQAYDNTSNNNKQVNSLLTPEGSITLYSIANENGAKITNGSVVDHSDESIQLKPLQSDITPKEENSNTNNQSRRNSEHKNDITQEFSATKSIITCLNEISSYLKSENEELKERSVIDEVEDEWKAMARVVDDICLKIYLALLVICHIAILIAAVTDNRLTQEYLTLTDASAEM